MEKLLNGKCSREVLFCILISFGMCFALLCLHDSNSLSFNNWVNVLRSKNLPPKDPCSGRYIYVHDDLPAKFNTDLLKDCKSLSAGSNESSETTNMCPYLVNLGLGPEINSSTSDGVLSNKSWFTTNPYLLEVIFHNRMKQYQCLTSIPTLASAIYIPYYTGIDATRHLWDYNLTIRDSSAKDVLRWLSSKPEWKRMWGRDHFFVTGRTSWDFRRQSHNGSEWGSGLRFLPESENISMLAVEGSLWKNDFAIPYPTNFHPAKDSDITEWQIRMRNLERPYLFSFVGAPRPGLEKSIRGELIDQCRSSSACKFVHCGTGGIDCNNPATVMKVFESSVYCLQPPGDSHTRRSAFDSILAGCIPVFFNPGSAYSQYLWHLPSNYTKYSVFIPARDVKDLKQVYIEKILLGIPKAQQLAMRNKVIKLISRLVYADPRSRLGTKLDAFDLAVKGILGRIENASKLIREGKDPSIGFAEVDSLKYTFPGELGW